MTIKQQKQGWQKKFKGSPSRGGAWIYTHPHVDGAIVHNHLGVTFSGREYGSVKEAMASAVQKVEGGS